MPKSVMKTTVGGGCMAGGSARRGLAIRSKVVAARHNQTLNEQNIRADFPILVDFIRIESNSPKGFLVYCAIVLLPASIIGNGNKLVGKNQWRRELAMSNVIPEKYLDLFQKPAFASLGTLMPDGRPQVTPVWCDFDGEHVIFNSARGRQKDRNVRRDPRVALAIIDPDNPYRYMEIRGTVVEITEDGAAQHIDKLAKKYMGVDKYPYAKPGEVRVMYKIRPEHTTVMG
jgi:PPOX class probable F420-dependent enzyme